jgi:hypothetical protein
MKEQGTLRQGSGQAGNGEQGDGALDGTAEPRTQNPEPNASDPPTLDPSPPSDQRPATSDQPAGVATASRTQTRAASLRIELRETEDEAADRDRLQRLLAALRDFPGEDEVRLTVRTLDGASQRVALPSARACPELTARLADVLSDAGEAQVVGKS